MRKRILYDSQMRETLRDAESAWRSLRRVQAVLQKAYTIISGGKPAVLSLYP